jgi:hypothetical protein
MLELDRFVVNPDFVPIDEVELREEETVPAKGRLGRRWRRRVSSA